MASLVRGESVLCVNNSGTRINLQKPQTPNDRSIRPELTINVERGLGGEVPVLSLSPCGIGDRTEVISGSRVEGEWITQGIIAPGECSRIVVGRRRDGRRDIEDRWLVGNLIHRDDL